MPTAEAASRTRRASAPSPRPWPAERLGAGGLGQVDDRRGALEERLQVGRRQVHDVGAHAIDRAAAVLAGRARSPRSTAGSAAASSVTRRPSAEAAPVTTTTLRPRSDRDAIALRCPRGRRRSTREPVRGHAAVRRHRPDAGPAGRRGLGRRPPARHQRGHGGHQRTQRRPGRADADRAARTGRRPAGGRRHRPVHLGGRASGVGAAGEPHPMGDGQPRGLPARSSSASPRPSARRRSPRPTSPTTTRSAACSAGCSRCSSRWCWR